MLPYDCLTYKTEPPLDIEAADPACCAKKAHATASANPEASRYANREPSTELNWRCGQSETRTVTPIEELRQQYADRPVTSLRGRPVYRFVKRTFDITFSLLVLAILSWLFALIAVAIKVDDRNGSIIFKQTRIGKDGKPFTMYKFRSMYADAESKLDELRELNERSGPVFKIANDPRITNTGKIIRKLSLDELPQFVNVLKGDMSVVGPRPALPSEVAEYTLRQRQRELIRPGITCYWQTRTNRHSIPFEEWMELDLLYIRKCGIWSDFKIIVQTVGIVLTAQGV